MKKPISRKRQTQNEAVFRNANEKVIKSLNKLNDTAEKQGDIDLINNEDQELHFYCECSDENCQERIQLSISRYRLLHKNRKQFILVPGHQSDIVEKVITKKNSYSLVEKFQLPSEKHTHLESTNINN